MLEDLVDTYAWSGWTIQNPNAVETVILNALSSSRLSDSKSLAEKEENYWWNTPTLRVSRICLRVCYTGAFSVPSTLRKLRGDIVSWIGLLCHPLAGPGRTPDCVDQRTIEDFIALLSMIAAYQKDGLAFLAGHDSVAFRIFLSLMIAAFANETREFTEQTYTHAYNLLADILHTYHGSPSHVNDRSVLAAMVLRPKDTADFFMRTWHWAFGVSVGTRTRSIRNCAALQLQCVSMLVELPDVRRHLIERGFITSVCLAARKVVRGEVEGLLKSDAADSTMCVFVDILVNHTRRPEHMREALDAHIISTILRIPEMSSALSANYMSVGLVNRCLAFMSKYMSYALFPTLRSGLMRSFARVDDLVARGAITWRGDDGKRLQQQYMRCPAVSNRSMQYSGRSKIPCSNTKVLSLIRRLHTTLADK